MALQIKELKYYITVTVENLDTGELINFQQLILKKSIDVTPVPIEIDKRQVLLYVEDKINEYCTSNDVSIDRLVVDGYEIEHSNVGIDIYFSVENMETFSLEPSVMVVESPSRTKPILEAEQINENTVKWSWSWAGAMEYTSVLSTFGDIQDRLIAHTPVGVSYHIESGLEENQTITREVTVRKGDVESKSIPVSISITSNSKSAIYRKWEAPKRNENYILENFIVSSRLKAFQSGVGDDDDCLIYKPNETKYAKRFKLANKIYGIRASSKIRYNTVKFFYRYMLKGKIDYKGYDGSFKIRGRAVRIPDINEEPTDEEYPEVCLTRNFCEYKFSDEAFVSEIYMYDIFNSLKEGYKDSRYKFEIEIYDINGRMEVYSQALGCKQIVDVSNASFNFELKGFYDTKFVVRAIPVLKQKDYIEIYPPEQYEPLVGAVNGDFEVVEDGKKDMISFAPEFDVPSMVFDKKYYCIMETDKTNPSVADVQYKFDQQASGTDYTLVNGDRCVFFCDTIIEDTTEYKEFITQVDKGEYIIDDNRKHNYRYKLELDYLNPKKYKRFELELSSNSNDIVILENEFEYDVIDNDKVRANVFVSVRALQNAIAKWNPYISSGYYYYNQEERFLYNRSNINGLNVRNEEFCFSGNISVNIKLHVKGGEGEYEVYRFSLANERDLNTNPNKFEFTDGKLWPKPLSVFDGFPEYGSEYVFYTKPFISPKEPTKILDIDWSQVTSTYTSVEVYAISYNDVYGEWREPILLTKDTIIPKDLIPSKIMMLKIVLKPSLRPNIKTRTYAYSCEAAWKEWMNKSLSYNIHAKEEVLETRSKKTKGFMVSRVHDLGDTLEKEKLRSATIDFVAKNEKDIKVYYQHGSDYSNLTNGVVHSDWELMIPNQKYMVDRYIRFKVEVTNEADIKLLKVILDRYEYTDMPKESYLPAIGNIRAEFEYNPVDFIKIIDVIQAGTLRFDKAPHIFVDNIKLLASNLGREHDFATKDVCKIEFAPIGTFCEDYDIIYNRSSNEPIILEKPLIIQSKKYIEDVELKENNQAGVVINLNKSTKTSLSPIPQQFSPIIVQEEIDNETIIVPYTQVYFMDDFGAYTLTNIEEMESLGFKTFYLKNYNLDETFTTVRVNGELREDFVVKDNLLIFDNEIPKGHEVSIVYRVKNSFIALYDYADDNVHLHFHGDSIYHKIEKVRVHYETHKTSSLRKLDHISLNPIYNPLYSGYMYISDKVTKPFKVSIVTTDNMIYANNIDTMNVLVIVEDKYGNPVQNVKVRATAAMGSLNTEELTTDINGIAKYIYKAWSGDCIDKIKAIVTDSVYADAEIINRKVTRDTTQ